MSKKDLKELKKDYEKIKDKIKKRLKEFQSIDKTNNKILFRELAFSLLTPQSKATICWKAIKRLKEKDLLLKGTVGEVRENLIGVRFKNNKARYIVEARKYKDILTKILEKKPKEVREFLVLNIKGLGFKEASHFLRNIGIFNFAILDRHILKNMLKYSYIKEIPKTISKNKYLEIEEKFFEFANELKIKPEELDLLLWYRQTGFIFK